MACLSSFEWRKFTTPKIGHIIHWLKWLSFRQTIHFSFGLKLGPMRSVWGPVVVQRVSSEGFERTINKRLVVAIGTSRPTKRLIGARANCASAANRTFGLGNPWTGSDKSLDKSFENVTKVVIKIFETFYEGNKSKANKENLSVTNRLHKKLG